MKPRNLLSRFNNWIIYLIFTAVVAVITISSTVLTNHLRKEETSRIKVFASAMKFLQDEEIGDPRVQELILSVIEENNSIPVIVTDRFGNPIPGMTRNLDDKTSQNPAELKKILTTMEETYPPLEVVMPDGKNQYIYYNNSDLLNNLRYYPVILGLFIAAYLAFTFWFYRTLKKTDEGYLWAGLAKETAHQIGTPLSSMIGWVEILKGQNVSTEIVKELEKDISRLKTISERFSKIGSLSELNDLNLSETLQQNYDYLKTRISRKIDFKLQLPHNDILLPHNRILMSWVVENLVKNAVDAMKGKGALKIALSERQNQVIIDVEDSGSGMTTAQARDAFKPGFSTKKRGWGLGLSLTKRVITDFHQGEVKILATELKKGTIFRIILKN